MPTQAQLDELDAIIADLKAHPERHRQDNYAVFVGDKAPTVTPAMNCGSAFCIAGAAVVRAGIGIQWFQAADGVWYANYTTELDEYGNAELISWVATRLLGLLYEDANELFAPNNNMQDIERIRASLTVTEATE